MGKKVDKPLCKLVKKGLVKDDPTLYTSLVIPGKYMCLKCGRISNKKKQVCKGAKIKEKERSM